MLYLFANFGDFFRSGMTSHGDNHRDFLSALVYFPGAIAKNKKPTLASGPNLF
jgi:hypothetical protein